MANSTTTTLASLISPIVQEALFTANERSVMRGLVKNFAVPMNSGKSVQVPVYPVVAAQALTEGTTMAGTSADIAVTTTTKTLTLAEVGVMTNLTDLMRDTSEADVISHLGKLFGEAIATKMDADLMGLFAGFSTEQGPGAGAELTVADIFQAAAELKSNNAPGEYFAVLHPKQVYAVKSALTNTFTGVAATDVGNEAYRRGLVGQIAGVNIIESSNVAVDGSGDSIGGVFSSEAMGLAMQNDLSIEIERNAALRADTVVATARYGVGELIDVYGVKLTSDATI